MVTWSLQTIQRDLFSLNRHFFHWRIHNGSSSFDQPNHRLFLKWKTSEDRFNFLSRPLSKVLSPRHSVHGTRFMVPCLINLTGWKKKFIMLWRRQKVVLQIFKMACMISSNIHFSKYILNLPSIASAKDGFWGYYFNFGHFWPIVWTIKGDHGPTEPKFPNLKNLWRTPNRCLDRSFIIRAHDFARWKIKRSSSRKDALEFVENHQFSKSGFNNSQEKKFLAIRQSHTWNLRPSDGQWHGVIWSIIRTDQSEMDHFIFRKLLKTYSLHFPFSSIQKWSNY